MCCCRCCKTSSWQISLPAWRPITTTSSPRTASTVDSSTRVCSSDTPSTGTRTPLTRTCPQFNCSIPSAIPSGNTPIRMPSDEERRLVDKIGTTECLHLHQAALEGMERGSQVERRSTRSRRHHAEQQMTGVDRVQVHIVRLHEHRAGRRHRDGRVDPMLAQLVEPRREAPELPRHVALCQRVIYIRWDVQVRVRAIQLQRWKTAQRLGDRAEVFGRYTHPFEPNVDFQERAEVPRRVARIGS